MTGDKSDAARFRAQFDRWTTRVRTRLAWRLVGSGTAIGLAIGALVCAVAWRSGHGALRPFAPLVGVVFAGAALAMARRRRWNDEEVALYLDARLGSSEAIATAIGVEDGGGGAAGAVLARATRALVDGEAMRSARPRVTRPVHLLGPAAVVAMALLVRAPMPMRDAHMGPPGAAEVRLDAAGLARVAKLTELTARDPAQRERLDAIARDAERLREHLRAGMARRDAQAEIARLQDALTTERLSLGAGDDRAGLESAAGRLAETRETEAAARALGDHDLQAMDREMERLANRAETADRARAKTALAEAARAARAAGAEAVARALEDQADSLERRAARAQTLRELAEAMKGMEAPRAESEALDREASDAAARAMARAMADALGKLTPDERRRVAEKLRAMQKHGARSEDAQTARELADALSTPEGAKRLEERLKELAREGSEPEEAARERGLEEAQRGAGEAGDQLGDDGHGEDREARTGGGAAVPVPRPGTGAGGGGRGPGSGAGTSATPTSTPTIAAQTLKSRAKGTLAPAESMPGAITTLAPGKAGATANQRGTGDLRAVGPGEVDGVERSDVPEEYREHVRQYFRP